MNETNILKKRLKYDFDGKVALVTGAGSGHGSVYRLKNRQMRVTGVTLKAVKSTICIFIKAADWG